MAGKRALSVMMFCLLASVGCRHWCERWCPCNQPVAAYPVAPATPCVPCVPCCPPGVSGSNSAPPAVPPPPAASPVTWNAPRGQPVACVPCQ